MFRGAEDVLLDAGPVDSCCSEDLRIHFTQPPSPPTAVGRDALPFSPHGIQVRRYRMLLVDRAARVIRTLGKSGTEDRYVICCAGVELGCCGPKRRSWEAELRRFLGERWASVSAIHAAIGLMLVFLALFVSIFAYFIAAGVRQTQQSLEDRSRAAAQVVATNAYWISEVANQTLRRVDTALGPQMLGNSESIQAVLDGLPSVVEVYVIDPEANTIYATVPGASAISVADREYFTSLRDGADFYTSPMIVSRLTGDHIFVFSKRVERNGAFAGAIMVSYSDQLLADLAGTLDLDAGSTIGLVRDDGQLMARFPAPDGAVDLSAMPLFTEYLPASAQGTYTSASSPVDGIARVVSYSQVEGTSIVALASVASTAVWNSFRAAVLTVLIIVSPIVVGLALGCWWIVVLLRRDSRQAADMTMLFQEIHHRIKNNMQSIQALVGMQDIPDAAKRDLRSRFSAMAAMHEHIYKHDRYVSVDAKDLIPAIVDEVVVAYGSDAEVSYELASVQIGRDEATPLALLLSELVTNCLKYAFGAGVKGHISISLSPAADGMATLIVRDNGVGLPEGGRTGSMGMRLIKGVVSQLEGEHVFRNDGGAVFEAKLRLS
ncbi:cache domain-containing protein [Devosia sp.]|uniref:sensor histidine kinase n=1 Tax=Devosia sp. TaxID=1871048 RepID=UPI003399A91B